MKRMLGVLLLLTAAGIAAADDWPSWRGPHQNQQSRETGFPLTWSATENVTWKAPLPGPGMSSPIVWKNRVFLTQSLDADGHRRALLCFDRATGRELWRGVIDYPDKESTYQQEPHYCSASPVTDGERVVVSFGSAGLACWDMTGKLLWHTQLGKCEQIWGNAASPILYQDLVIHNFGPGVRTFLIALDKRTGKEVWRVDIPGGSFGEKPTEWNGSWSTPLLVRAGDRDELVLMWPEVVKAYDPRTGRELWSCSGATKLAYTSPIAAGDMIFALYGFGGSAVAVRTGGSGDVTASHRVWVAPRNPQRIGSGVVVGDHLYVLNAIGTLECVEVKTGRSLWSERTGAGAWGSLVQADGRLYATNQQGETVVAAAEPQFKILARNPLGERSQSTPALSRGQIFIRTYGHLWCIGKER